LLVRLQKDRRPVLRADVLQRVVPGGRRTSSRRSRAPRGYRLSFREVFDARTKAIATRFRFRTRIQHE
jgi:hypothetical protein